MVGRLLVPTPGLTPSICSYLAFNIYTAYQHTIPIGKYIPITSRRYYHGKNSQYVAGKKNSDRLVIMEEPPYVSVFRLRGNIASTLQTHTQVTGSKTALFHQVNCTVHTFRYADLFGDLHTNPLDFFFKIKGSVFSPSYININAIILNFHLNISPNSRDWSGRTN